VGGLEQSLRSECDRARGGADIAGMIAMQRLVRNLATDSPVGEWEAGRFGGVIIGSSTNQKATLGGMWLYMILGDTGSRAGETELVSVMGRT